MDSYTGLFLANGVNMKPQINLWFLQTQNSTIYGNNNVSKLFSIWRCIWDEFKRFFSMYDPQRYPKNITAKQISPKYVGCCSIFRETSSFIGILHGI